MDLDELLSPWTPIDVKINLTAVENNSRCVKKGSLFLAYPGVQNDGRQYIDGAIKAGAVAIAYDPAGGFQPSPMLPLPCIPIVNLADQVSRIAARFYQKPGVKSQIVGVTGTNGKTTIALQLAKAHQLLGHQAAYIGTLGEGLPDALSPVSNTTPDGLVLSQLLAKYASTNVDTVCLEVSSHALDQGRVDEIDFQQAIFTNLTLDHLDYHKTMAAYAKAKARLFGFPNLDYAIINSDSDYAKVMMEPLKPSTTQLHYGFNQAAMIRVLDWQTQLSGSTMTVQSPFGQASLQIQTPGLFNVYNMLAVFASLLASGLSLTEVEKIFPKLSAVPGRMEVVALSPYVIVDYAHTPDALDNVLSTLLPLKGKGRLMVVFGCGGDRDKSKRPLMGKMASQKADFLIITSDNPRTESPMAIIDEIITGIAPQTQFLTEVDRRTAIAKAISLAAPGDLILIAGKGHESYQEIDGVRLPFSDKGIIQALLSGA